MNKGIVIFILTACFLVALCWAPSINAEAYDRFRLVDSWTSGNTKTCLYANVRKEQRTKSISKGRSCPSVY